MTGGSQSHQDRYYTVENRRDGGIRQGGRLGPALRPGHRLLGTTEEDAAQTAHRMWPNAAVPGELAQKHPMPAHFEQASQQVPRSPAGEMLLLGADAERHIEGIRKYLDAVYDHV